MSERFAIGSSPQFEEGAGSAIEVAGHRVAVFRIDGQLYAIGDRCSHAEASLAAGEIFDHGVECPRHGSEFDVRTGEPHSLPATAPVATYSISEENDEVVLEIDAETEES